MFAMTGVRRCCSSRARSRNDVPGRFCWVFVFWCSAGSVFCRDWCVAVCLVCSSITAVAIGLAKIAVYVTILCGRSVF